MTEYPLTNIDRDETIQCRAAVSLETVQSYADDMTEGAKFPPIDLYGTKDKAWIGDGWHRVEAATLLEWKSIPAVLRPGGRVDALKHALSANAVHGQRRTNADKRKCVQVALREFKDLSDRAIAKLCGVSQPFVGDMRPKERDNVYHLKRIGADGKQYPATRAPKAEDEADDDDDKPRVKSADEEMESQPKDEEPPRVRTADEIVKEEPKVPDRFDCRIELPGLHEHLRVAIRRFPKADRERVCSVVAHWCGTGELLSNKGIAPWEVLIRAGQYIAEREYIDPGSILPKPMSIGFEIDPETAKVASERLLQ
jgi:hypothetical protein